MKKVFKQFALTMLPEKALQVIKQVHYLRTLKLLSENEEADFKVIKHLVGTGSYVVDVGANIGVYTKFLSDVVGVHGRVFSIEPIILTFQILCSNIKKLKLKNVKLINCAISDINSYVTMEVPLYDSGGENFYQARIVEENTHHSLRRVRVESRTLDSLFSESNNIAFIKVDVEGHELKCIKGAMNIIKNSKPAWLIEISEDPDDPKSTAYETFKLLSEEGYEAFWFDGKNINRRKLSDMSISYFFLAVKHLQALQRKNLLALEEELVPGNGNS